MQISWNTIRAKLESRTARERVMICFVIAGLGVALVNTLLFEPIFAQAAVFHRKLAELQEQRTEVQSQITDLNQKNDPHVHTPQQDQIQKLKQEMVENEAYLNSSRERLVPPEQMATHLRQLLNSNPNIQLASLQTLPATPLLDSTPVKLAATPSAQPKPSRAAQDPQVFKHGVQLTLRGRYLDLLNALSSLERLPQQMYWAKIKMNVAQSPSVELTLTLYTLSLEKTWLKI